MELAYLDVITDYERVEFTSVCTLTHPLDFIAEIEEAQLNNGKSAELHEVEHHGIYLFVGDADEVGRIRETTRLDLRQLFERSIAGEEPEQIVDALLCDRNEDPRTRAFLERYLKGLFSYDGVRYPIDCQYDLDEGFALVGFSSCEDPSVKELADEMSDFCITRWRNMERLWFCGRQLVTKGFELDGLRSRRLVGPHYDSEEECWEILMDGSKRLLLNDSLYPQVLATDSAVVGRWTESDVRGILANPAYAFGVIFEYPGYFEDWNDAFLYICAVSLRSEDVSVSNIRKLYESFLAMMKERFDYVECPPIIETDLFIQVVCREIESVQEYLAAHEGETYRGRSYVARMPWQTYHLRELLEHLKDVPNFYQVSMRKLESDAPFTSEDVGFCLEQDDATSKGLAFEQLVEKLLNAVPTLRQTGKRIRDNGCEIDLCYCNASLDADFWKMGSLFLVECKNWERPVGMAAFRNFAYVMRMKGCTTGILLTTGTFTSAVEKEAIRLALIGSNVLLLAHDDLERIAAGENPMELIKDKYQALIRVIGDDERIFS